MIPIDRHVIKQHREWTWIRYPRNRALSRSKNTELIAAHYRDAVRSLDFADLSKRSDPSKQYNQSRQTRHQAIYEHYRCDRDQIMQSIQNDVLSELEQLKNLLDRSQIEIQSILVRNLTGQAISEMTLDAFESFWTQVSRQHLDRERIASESGKRLQERILSRVGEMKELVRGVICELVDIAFQLQPGLEYLFYTDLLPVNLQLIDLNVIVAEFRSRLRIAEIRLQQRHRSLYEERRRVWRSLQHDRAMYALRDQFASDLYANPEWRRFLLEDLRRTDQRLGASLDHLLSGLYHMSVPSLTSSQIVLIQGEIQVAMQAAQRNCNRYLQALMDALRTMETDMQNRVSDLVLELDRYGALEPDQIRAQVQAQVGLYIDEYRDRFTKQIDHISASLQQHERTLTEQLAAAMKLYLSAARVWETSLKSIDDLEVETNEAWMRRLDLYDDELNLYEDELNGITKGMREAPNEQILSERFVEAIRILGPDGRIQQCHQTFLRESLEIARGHGPRLEKVLADIGTSVQSVMRLNCPSRAKIGALLDTDEMDIGAWVKQIMGDVGNASGLSLGSATAPQSGTDPADPLTNLVCRYAFDLGQFGEIIGQLRLAFAAEINRIAHHECDRVRLLIDERTRHVSTLVNKSLRILAPRIIQLEVDVVHVRQTELTNNLRRLQRFWDRYDKTFSKGDAAMTSACALIDKLLSDRSAEIDRIKQMAADSSTLQKLQLLHNKSEDLSRQFRHRVRAQLKLVKSLQGDVQVQLQQLCDQFQASCCVFGSSGNSNSMAASFHPDELKRYESEVLVLKSESDRQLANRVLLVQALHDQVKAMIAQRHLNELLQKAKADLAKRTAGAAGGE